MSKRTQIANPNDPRNVDKTNPNDMFHDENEAESNVISKVFIGKVKLLSLFSTLFGEHIVIL
jgi:hypothetical protein